MKNFEYLKHFEKKHVLKMKTREEQGLMCSIAPGCSPQRGDYIQVGFLVQEGEANEDRSLKDLDLSKTRVQLFDGIVLSIHGSSFEKRVTLRQPRRPGSFSIERTFSLQSPQIQNLKVLQSQHFRRSKLFYLRKRVGKAAFGTKKNVRLSSKI